jgi:hypothetical protein
MLIFYVRKGVIISYYKGSIWCFLQFMKDQLVLL